MPAADKELQLLVRREIGRRPLDITLLDVHAVHGVVYMTGTIRAVRGANIDLKHEMNIVEHMLKLKPGVRDVVNDCMLR